MYILWIAVTAKCLTECCKENVLKFILVKKSSSFAIFPIVEITGNSTYDTRTKGVLTNRSINLCIIIPCIKFHIYRMFTERFSTIFCKLLGS